jgi:hypothetical protein
MAHHGLGLEYLDERGSFFKFLAGDLEDFRVKGTRCHIKKWSVQGTGKAIASEDVCNALKLMLRFFIETEPFKANFWLNPMLKEEIQVFLL